MPAYTVSNADLSKATKPWKLAGRYWGGLSLAMGLTSEPGQHQDAHRLLAEGNLKKKRFCCPMLLFGYPSGVSNTRPERARLEILLVKASPMSAKCKSFHIRRPILPISSMFADSRSRLTGQPCA